MAKINEVPDFEAMLELVGRASRAASVIALNHFKNSFKNEGFTDVGLVKWQERKNDKRPGGAVLVSTANLRDSIQDPLVETYKVTIVNTAPYAKIHNEGGTIKTKYATIVMPQRQFMGDSAVMRNDFENWFINEKKKIKL